MKLLDVFDLSGKVSIITGGGTGIGRVMALALAEAGSNIVVCSRKIENCESTAHIAETFGVKAMPLQCNIVKEADIDFLVEETLKRFKKIDVLINNSGRTWGASPEEIDVKDWQKVIDLNVTGTFLCTQKVGREMIKRKRGKIINIASYAGLRGTDPEYLNAIPYNTSKGAIVSFTKDLATKWAKYNINVNCIAPGWFKTKMTEWVLENKGDIIHSRLLIKRFGEDKDIKGVVVFLASKASDYMTGQVISVDGGLTAW